MRRSCPPYHLHPTPPSAALARVSTTSSCTLSSPLTLLPLSLIVYMPYCLCGLQLERSLITRTGILQGGQRTIWAGDKVGLDR